MLRIGSNKSVILVAGKLALLALLYAQGAFAQNFNAGYQKYTRGDFKGAEASFKTAIKSKSTPQDKAQIFKYLGISQYMLGKKQESGESLKRALKINPRIAISSNEVLDESIIGFFSNLKKGSKGVAHQNKKEGTPPADSREASAPSEKPNTRSAVAASQVTKGAKKGTYVLVNSNVSTATVSLDGILSGSVGALIEADAGQAVVEVEAPGYVSRKMRLNVATNRENTITVNLEHAKPKPEPKPEPKPQVAKSQKKEPKKKNKKDSNTGPQPGDNMFDDVKDVKNDDEKSGGGRDLSAEFKAETAAGAAGAAGGAAAAGSPNDQAEVKKSILQRKQRLPEPKPGTSAPTPLYMQQQPYSPAQQGKNPAERSQYPQQNQYQQGGYPQQQAQGGQQYTQQPYPPQQYPGQQGYAQNQPPPQQQQPQAQQQQGYAQPNAPPQPPPQPAPGSGPVIYNNPQGQQQQPQPSVRQNKTKRKVENDKIAKNSQGTVRTTKSSSGGDESILIALLPLGAGQFQNGNYWLGSTFALSELGAGYWYYISKTEADQEVQVANDYFNSSADAQSKQDFQNQANSFINEKRQEENYAIYLGATLYVAGVIEAIIDVPSDKPVRKKSRSVKRKIADAECIASRRETCADEDEFNFRKTGYLPDEFNFGLVGLDSGRQIGKPYEPMLGVSARWEF